MPDDQLSDQHNHFRTPRTGRQWGRIRPIARDLRSNQTRAEDVLWQRLRGKQVNGVRFRRQHVIGSYIVDFYCAKAHLVIEVDGPIHEHTHDQDADRQENLEHLGLRVIRFSNDDVLGDLDRVMAAIRAIVDEMKTAKQAPNPFPPQVEEGE